MINKILLILFLCAFSVSSYSQQLPIYSQYNYNEFSINPAIAGTKDFSPLFMTFRNQWSGFLDGGGPKTQILSYHTEPLRKVGLGGTIFNDKTGGALSFYGFQLGPSYHLDFKEGLLSLGISGNFYMYQFDKSDFSTDDPIYSSVSSGSRLTPSASLGVFYKKDNYFGGISVANIFESDLNITSSESNTLNKHMFFNLGTYYSVFKEKDTEISVLLKKTSSTNIQFDLNTKINLGDYFWTGISYRQKESASLLFGLEYKELMIGYTYDYLISDISSYSIGSHEFFVGYRFGKREIVKQIKGCMDSLATNYDRFATLNDSSDCKYQDPCSDRDGDGCCDDVDECPDEAGPGSGGNAKDCCPIKDTDGDGCEDWEDSCPEMPGPASNDCCPVDIEVISIFKPSNKIIDDQQEEQQQEEEVIVKIKKDKEEDVKVAIQNLKNIEFNFDEAVLLPRYTQYLLDVIDLINLNKDIKVVVSGHTDYMGSNKYNDKLSLERALAVKSFLLDNGVKMRRIVTEHYGENIPIFTNESEEGRALNRRVELRIIFE